MLGAYSLYILCALNNVDLHIIYSLVKMWFVVFEGLVVQEINLNLNNVRRIFFVCFYLI